VVFVGWEGVGLCSYLLIGFYYERMFDEKTRMSCADAGRKAFITNRIGDMGFILGMLLLFEATGTLEIQGILSQVGGLGPGICTAAALLLFLGACGKSAQIPLFVWLPDAMAGPTPVSALIHAATMVKLGYMMLAAGVGAYTAAIFHLMTHAFFKALLFLGAGSVIHAMSGEQNIRKMGGLGRHRWAGWAGTSRGPTAHS
jgi:NADH-quinone oxidoreductase subunit L